MTSSARADFLGVTWGGTAVLIHQSDGTAETIGPTGYINLNTMAKDPQGRFITANDGAGTPKLLRVDPVLGIARIHHFPFLNDIRALSYDRSGVLYAIDVHGGGVTNNLYWLDLSVPAGDGSIAHYVGKTTIDSIQDMAFAADGSLYGWSIGAGLITIDPSTAVAADVNGLVDGTPAIQSIAFAPDGTLYGAGADLYVIDRTSGSYTRIGSSGLDVRGMAYLDPDAPIAYCIPKYNSQNCYPSISSSGTASITGPDNFVIRAGDVVDHASGFVIWSANPQQVSFQGGYLCVVPPIQRTPAQNSAGTAGVPCSGSFQFRFSQNYMAQHALGAGARVNAQYYYRDGQHPDGTGVGLTDALHFTIGP